MTSVYDHLEGLESDAAINAAKELFVLAGTYGYSGDGYFFNNEAPNIINNARQVDVRDGDGNVVQTFPSLDVAITSVHKNEIPGLDSGNFTITTRIAKGELEILRTLRDAIRKELVTRENAKKEFSVAAVMFGQKLPTEDEVRRKLTESLDL